jgi:aerobic-type carbon monoxide dehydrogenase small subunit (CoxS/CutS family)
MRRVVDQIRLAALVCQEKQCGGCSRSVEGKYIRSLKRPQRWVRGQKIITKMGYEYLRVGR